MQKSKSVRIYAKTEENLKRIIRKINKNSIKKVSKIGFVSEAIQGKITLEENLITQENINP
jgi:hypothetical protein